MVSWKFGFSRTWRISYAGRISISAANPCAANSAACFAICGDGLHRTAFRDLTVSPRRRSGSSEGDKGIHTFQPDVDKHVRVNQRIQDVKIWKPCRKNIRKLLIGLLRIAAGL